MLRERIVNLASPEDVVSFLKSNPTSVLFKAGTCHKTMQGFGFLQEKLEPREDLMVGVIRVVEARAASNLIADKTGIRHESPQVILFKDGDAVFDVDNWDITPDTLSTGFDRIPAGDAVETQPGAAASDLAPYLTLLEQYLAGDLDDTQFEFSYTTLFRDDASLRPNAEVELLGSIFGDVDRHMTMHMMMAGRGQDPELRAKAQQAYDGLKALATPA